MHINYELTVIVPFRCESESTYYLIERLNDLINEFPVHGTLPIEFMVVDSGSSKHYQKECESICYSKNITYLYQDTAGKPFSIGACRDFGVQNAQGKAVSFLDVDLRVTSDFWIRLLTLMKAWGVSKYKKSFLAIPCLYLTQEGTVEFLQQEDQDVKFADFYMRYLQGDKSAIENLALCSSVMVVDRNHYLSVGGHDPEFRGHGYEDFELYHRLLCEENIIPKTNDYYLDQKTWDTYSYTGFRSHLAMIARPALMFNLFVVHLWHPRPKNVSFYTTSSVIHNRNMWVDKFKQFSLTNEHPEPLANLTNSQSNVLFFGKPRTNAAACLKDIFPHLGNVIYTSEYDFINRYDDFQEDDFVAMLNSNNIQKIIFPNPYGNHARLKIYRWCKKANFPFYCYERGALPDSWFFDANGFNADSISYKQSFWDKPISSEDIQKIEDYIHNTIYGSNFLEKQGSRIGAEALAAKLQLNSKKVLFVPLQRPSDTVIKYMSGNAKSYINFIKIIDKLADRLRPMGWVVLCKKHPLETESPHLNHAQYVDENTNFIDLLELADSVALINSGVGIYAMMMNKPCYIFGEAFYATEGINQIVPEIDVDDSQHINELALSIMKGFCVDKDKSLRFIHYLVSTFYSFGTPKTISRKESDGSLRTITTGIDFYNFRLDSKTIFEYENTSRPKLALSAPIFERYALDIHLRKKAGAAQPKKADAATKKPVVAAKPVDKNTTSTTVKKDLPTIQQTTVSQTDTKIPIVNSVSKQIKTQKEIKHAKLAKFRKDPYAFCADSKQPVIRMLRVFFKK